MKPTQGNWKLFLGRTFDAWKQYPKQRQEIASIPSGPPILVSGTHRSGTTWVAKMLAVPGLWYIHEPFNPNKEIWSESFTYVRDTGAAPAVEQVMQQVLKGGLRRTAMNGSVDHPLMPLRLLKPPIQRVMIKDPLACLLTGYFTHQYNFQTLVLFRHPCGFVSSVNRLGWPTGKFLKDFLSRDELMSDYLSPYEQLISKHAEENTIASAAILHGALNLVLWDKVQKMALRWELFEELCQDPINKFRDIFDWLNLPYTPETRKSHEQLCVAGSKDPTDYHPHAVARNSSAMAWSWRSQLASAEIDIIRDIWEQFEIPLYQENAAW